MYAYLLAIPAMSNTVMSDMKANTASIAFTGVYNTGDNPPETLPPGVDPPRPISDQPVQQIEPDRWNDEQIDAGDVGGVIAQEPLPTRERGR